MTFTADPSEQEFSLVDAYVFFLEHIKTICAMLALGLMIGLAVAFGLPAKYPATAAIETGRVLGKDVESAGVLADRMSSPTYYSQNTLDICYPNAAKTEDLSQRLAKELGPKIGRQSTFVTIGIRSASSAAARRCLEAVLADVTLNQSIIADSQIEKARTSLAIAKEKLVSAKEFVAAFSGKTPSFDFKDAQFSASSLLISTWMAKQNEIKALEEQIDSLSKDLSVPQTKPASFATPIYAPDEKAGPSSILICLIGMVFGVIGGFAFVCLRRLFRNLSQQASQRIPNC